MTTKSNSPAGSGCSSHDLFVCALGNLRDVARGLYMLGDLRKTFENVAPLKPEEREWVESQKEQLEEKKTHLRAIFERRENGETFVAIARDHGVTMGTVRNWYYKAESLNRKGWLYQTNSKL